ncbi:MAG: hypothetical protein ACI32C_05065 [Candidatus Enteromonas sp.]
MKNSYTNVDPMEDKDHNLPEKNKGFYWVPLCLAFFPVFFAISFAFPLFPVAPEILVGEGIAASSLSGYQLIFASPLSATFFALTVISWAYLCFVGVFVAFKPNFRTCGKLNALMFPGLIAMAIGTMAALIATVSYVSSFENDLGPYTPFDFANITYWILMVLPMLLLIWWIAVNLSNLRLHRLEEKKKAALSQVGEKKGEEDVRKQ